MRTKPFLAMLSAFVLSAVAPGAEPTREEARAAVFQFERSLQHIPRDAKGDANRTRLVREFFAKLKDSPTKIEAIGMINDRFVHQIPHGLESELLGKLLDDKEPAVQVAAARALAYTGKGADHAERLLALLKDAGVPLRLEMIAAMGRAAKEKSFFGPLKEQLAHREPSVRIAAASALTAWPAKDAHAPVVGLLGDPEPRVRAAVVQDLPRFRVAADAARIVKLLEDPSPLVRQRAIPALAAVDRQSAPKAIARLLTDPEHLVRAQAAETLGSLRATEFAPEVAKRLEDEDVVVRRYATQALGELGGREYLGPLRTLTRDADDMTRRLAAEAVAAIEKRLGPK